MSQAPGSRPPPPPASISTHAAGPASATAMGSRPASARGSALMTTPSPSASSAGPTTRMAGEAAILVVGPALEADGDGVVISALPRADAGLEPIAVADAGPAAWVDIEAGGGGGLEPGACDIADQVHVNVLARLVAAQHRQH